MADSTFFCGGAKPCGVPVSPRVRGLRRYLDDVESDEGEVVEGGEEVPRGLPAPPAGFSSRSRKEEVVLSIGGSFTTTSASRLFQGALELTGA